MDSRFIEVALGLVLVILLTSLLTTAIQEAWSSWRGMRGKVLRQALVSFLGDDEQLARALMSHPLLVSMSPEVRGEHDKRRPSYMGADTVVAALLQHLSTVYAGGMRPSTPVQLLDAMRGDASGRHAADKAGADRDGDRPSSGFVEGLAALVQGVEQDWPAFEARVAAWYDAVGERSSGWFKRRVQFGVFTFGMLLAAAININPIVIATRLWDDEPLRRAMADAAQRFEASSRAQPGPAVATDPPSPAASAAAAAASAPVQSWSQALERYAGSLARAMNASAPGGPHNDALLAAAARTDDMLRLTAAWQEAGDPLPAGGLDALRRSLSAAAPSLPAVAYGALLDDYQRLSILGTRAFQQAERAAAPAPAAAPDPKDCANLQEGREACERYNDLMRLQQAGLPLGWTGAARPTLFDRCPQPRPPGGTGCKAPEWGQAAWWGNASLMLAGWFIMGLACTFGSPFWFDILGRLVRLRSAGGRPERAETGEVRSSGSGPGLLARSRPDASPPAAAPHASSGTPMSDALTDAEHRLARSEIERVQRRLGLPEAEVTGWFDGPTRRAIQAWQERQQLLPADGALSEAQARELLALGGPGKDGDGYLG